MGWAMIGWKDGLICSTQWDYHLTLYFFGCHLFNLFLQKQSFKLKQHKIFKVAGSCLLSTHIFVKKYVKDNLQNSKTFFTKYFVELLNQKCYPSLMP